MSSYLEQLYDAQNWLYAIERSHREHPRAAVGDLLGARERCKLLEVLAQLELTASKEHGISGRT